MLLRQLDYCVALHVESSKIIYHRRHGSTLDTLSRGGRQYVDGYFNIFGSKRLCDDVIIVGEERALDIHVDLDLGRSLLSFLFFSLFLFLLHADCIYSVDGMVTPLPQPLS